MITSQQIAGRYFIFEDTLLGRRTREMRVQNPVWWP